ncbi:Flp family type IVb pilin [Sphingomonas sp. SUN039]|uniref:Flp family type IVb pilin n=1 Tax=Sphingomonas sp. SUN039 TaxID=2937787 RepID=UPI002164D7B9|nr:Flp family type IVb pilin [Sphingomonas sp. SUN039]UVO53459.1 Flp family type IVb pilin [Sphingomonas sp. SUN039]
MGRRLDRGLSMRSGLSKLLRDKRGATAIEYGLIAALVVLGAFLGIKNFATTSVNMWNNVSNTVAKS